MEAALSLSPLAERWTHLRSSPADAVPHSRQVPGNHRPAATPQTAVSHVPAVPPGRAVQGRTSSSPRSDGITNICAPCLRPQNPGNFLPHPSQMPFEAYPLNTAAPTATPGALPAPVPSPSGPALPPVSLLRQAVRDRPAATAACGTALPTRQGDCAAPSPSTDHTPGSSGFSGVRHEAARRAVRVQGKRPAGHRPGPARGR